MSSLSKKVEKPIEDVESSNFFFHFTPKIDNLLSILNNYFMPFYCLEDLHFLNIGIEGMAYPVVCFCDIPLSRHLVHREKFGEYGIAMKKAWGIERRNHLTPVVYTHENSVTCASLKNLFELAPSIKSNLKENEFSEYNNSVSTLMMHYKSYEGYSYIKDKNQFSITKKRFYDEREWRYIPLEVDGLKLNLELVDYQNEKILKEENEKIQAHNKMKFELADIEHLILKENSEIDEFLYCLTSKYNNKDLEEIRRKIVSHKP